jgi:hypothetical protein
MNQIYLAMAIPTYSLLQIQQAYISDYQKRWMRMFNPMNYPNPKED